MALWVTAVLALACLGGLAAPGPVPRSVPLPLALKELIEELSNITQDQVSSTHSPFPEEVMSRLGLGLCE